MADVKEKIGVMIGINTYGTEPNSVVRQICLIKFKFDDPAPIEALLLYPDVSQQIVGGRTKSLGAINWWNTLNKEKHQVLLFRESVYMRTCEETAKMVLRFINDLKKKYIVHIVTKDDVTFELPIIEDFLEQYSPRRFTHLFCRTYDLQGVTGIIKDVLGIDIADTEADLMDLYDECVEGIHRLRIIRELKNQ